MIVGVRPVVVSSGLSIQVALRGLETKTLLLLMMGIVRSLGVVEASLLVNTLAASSLPASITVFIAMLHVATVRTGLNMVRHVVLRSAVLLVVILVLVIVVRDVVSAAITTLVLLVAPTALRVVVVSRVPTLSLHVAKVSLGIVLCTISIVIANISLWLTHVIGLLAVIKSWIVGNMHTGWHAGRVVLLGSVRMVGITRGWCLLYASVHTGG